MSCFESEFTLMSKMVNGRCELVIVKETSLLKASNRSPVLSEESHWHSYIQIDESQEIAHKVCKAKKKMTDLLQEQTKLLLMHVDILR